MNFAVCVDANKGAREAAKQRKKEKDFAFAQEGLKFHNRETSYAKTLDLNVIGYSRTTSDAYTAALYKQGKGRQELENATKAYFGKKQIDEGGRSRRFGKKQYGLLLAARNKIEGIDRTNFGRNMAYAQEGAKRQFQPANAQAKEKLGLPPQYGLPVPMPPTDYLTGTLNMASQVMGIATGFAGLSTPKTPTTTNYNFNF